MNISNGSNKPFPFWGILSVTLTPLAGLFAHLVTMTVEGVWGSPFTQSYTVERGTTLDAAILGADRVVLLVAWAFVAFGIISAIIASAKRERPRWLPVFGVVTTALFISMALYLAYPD
jgi:threonine/homoserine/homoserine lactone efflux protein